MESPLRACIYARNSRGGRSVDDQLADSRDDCTRNTWTWTSDDEFVDVGRSASAYARRTRERFDEMVSRIQAGRYDVVVAWESSRLQRDLEVYVFLRNLCRENRVLWSLNGRVYDMSNRQDRFMTGLDALRAEDEVDGIRDRNLRTTRRGLERGWMHGQVSYGFRREYDPLTGRLLRQVEHPEQAPLVAEMTRRVAAGDSCAGIANDLTRRGIPTQQGAKRWSATVVRQIVSNFANIGHRAHYGQDGGSAVWDAIVDPGDFHAARAILTDPGRKSTNERAVKHLLSGLPRCGVEGCGQKMVWLTHKSPKYGCPEFHNSIREPLLDRYVEEAVLLYLERMDVASMMSRRSADGRLRESMRMIAEKEAELEAARATVGLPDGLSPTSLAALERNVLPLIEAARNKIRSAIFPAAVAEMAGPAARGKWEKATVPERRAVLREVIGIEVHKGGQGVRTIRPGRVVLTWPLGELR